MTELRHVSERAQLDFFHMRRIDLLEFDALAASRDGYPVDLREAIDEARQTYNTTRRNDCLVRLWQLTFDNQVDRGSYNLNKDIYDFLAMNPSIDNRLRGHAYYWLILSTDIRQTAGKRSAEEIFRTHKSLIPKRHQHELSEFLKNGNDHRSRGYGERW
jgi:hypothetical protein